MHIIKEMGNDNLAKVYIAENSEGKRIEFVESINPGTPISEKWILIISTLYGCPTRCIFCDAGGFYKGKLSYEDLLFQIEYPVTKRFPDKFVDVKKFKIQFCRMGEPSYNKEVLRVIDNFHRHFKAPGFMPSISTIAPFGRDEFFNELIRIKNKYYIGRFQMQFSLHTTNEEQVKKFIPFPRWPYSNMAEFGDRYFTKGDRKIALNFALSSESELDATKLIPYFSPEKFMVKITPMNPTFRRNQHKLASYEFDGREADILRSLQSHGYDVVVSVNDFEENSIGSNCGQFVTRMENEEFQEAREERDFYTYA
jgi:23S rRNA (adenine2503-C2)-methyltransferase